MDEWASSRRWLIATGAVFAFVLVIVLAVLLIGGGSDGGETVREAPVSIGTYTTTTDAGATDRKTTPSARSATTSVGDTSTTDASEGVASASGQGGTTTPTDPTRANRTTSTTVRRGTSVTTRVTDPLPHDPGPSATSAPPLPPSVTTAPRTAPPPPTPSAATTAAPTVPPPPTQPPEAIITLVGSDPPVGTFDPVTLHVSSSDGTIPSVVVASGDCTLSGGGSASPILTTSTFNLPLEGERCMVRASGQPAPGFVKAADKELTIEWTPEILRVRWSQPVRDGDTVRVTMSSTDAPGVGNLDYSSGCSGSNSVSAGETLVITSPGACTVSAEPAVVNQSLWIVVDTLVIAPP